MNQDSDGIAEVMRGGAQMGLTLAAQTVEALARQRQHAQQREAGEQQELSRQMHERAHALQVRTETAADAEAFEGSARADAQVWDSPQRRAELAARLTPASGAQSARVRAVADVAQAYPASAVLDLPPPAAPSLSPQGPSAHTRARQVAQQSVRGVQGLGR